MNRPPPLQFVAAPGSGSLTQVPVSIAFVVPVRTSNAANMAHGMSRMAAFAKMRQHREEHRIAHLCARGAMATARLSPCDLVPAHVVVARRSSHWRGLDDHDGLRSALKWVVDGVAHALGVDDGSRSAVTWDYANEKCARGEFGVRVTITRRKL